MSKKNLPRRDSLAGEVINGFTLVKQVGNGNHGVVYRAERIIDSRVQPLLLAIKLIPSSNLKDGYEAEFQKVQLLSDVPEVVNIRWWENSRFDDTEFMCIAYDYVNGSDLKSYCSEHPEAVTLPFIENVINTLLRVYFALGQTGISHGDIHAGNLMVSESSLSYRPDQVIRITDFGIGGSNNGLVPKDDFVQLATLCRDLLGEYVDPADLTPRDRESYQYLAEDFLPKRLLEQNASTGAYMRDPGSLIAALEAHQIRLQRRRDWKKGDQVLSNPFEYLSCEQLTGSFELLQKLYTKNFPGYQDLLKRSNTILTGPRGCGKTTIFRNLSLRAQILGGGANPRDEDRFVGIYYHCSDLYFTFSYTRRTLNDQDAGLLIHYTNLNLLKEILDTLSVAEADPEGLLSDSEQRVIQDHLSSWLSGYNPPPSGTRILAHLRSFVEGERHRLNRSLRKPHRSLSETCLPIDFIPQFCEILTEKISWLQGRVFFILLDDYSTPHVSRQVQSILNDVVMRRWSGCFFKISTESIVSFHPYDSAGKLMEGGREYDTVDLGAHFIHKPGFDEGNSAIEARRQFIVEVIDNRLKNTENIDPSYHSIEQILGSSNLKYNEMARRIRTGEPIHYFGIDVLTDMFSGDIADVLRIVQAIFRAHGGAEAMTNPGVVPLPISPATQDRAVRSYGSGFLERIEAVPVRGVHLREVVNAFGRVANQYLRHRDAKNEKGTPPWQAFRIEMREPPPLDDERALRILYPSLVPHPDRDAWPFDRFRDEINETYRDLLRYGAFLRDLRGKSVRGHVVPRLYLRRLLIPTFTLTPSQRDSVPLEPVDFLLLLFNPSRFEKIMGSRIKKFISPDQGEIFGETP